MHDRLLARIEEEERSTRRSFRVAMVAVAAAVLAAAGTATVLTRGEPDGDADDTVTSTVVREHVDPVEAARAEAFDPESVPVDAERIACYGSGSWPGTSPEVGAGPTVGQDDDLALTDPLTEAGMIDACARSYYYDSVAGADLRPTPLEAAMCARETAAGFTEAVVVFDGLPCGHADARPFTDDDLAALEHQRAVEVALLADDRECPTQAETVDLVEDVLAEERLDLTIRLDDDPIEEPGADGETVTSPAPPCPRYARVDWERGEVVVQPFRA
jgi:hypothetical protein